MIKSTNVTRITAGTGGFTRVIAMLALALAVGLIVVQPAMMQKSRAELDIQAAPPPVYVPQQLCLQLLPGYEISVIAAMYGLDPVPVDQAGNPPKYLMRIADGSTVEQKVAQLNADLVRVDYAEPNSYHQAPEAARPTWSVGDSYAMVAAGRKTYNGQWSRSAIRLDEAQQVTRGAGVIVAVLDTGIDLNHPLFAGRLVPASDMYDFVDGDTNPSEEGNPQLGPYGHGTHVAGLVAMVAPEAKIMPIRVLGVDGRGTAFSLAKAVEFAVTHGADVVNISISTPSRMIVVQQMFYDLLEGEEDVQGTMTGAVAVVAAGNSGDSVVQYPAAETASGRPGREVLAVSASDSNNLLTIFSTRGSWVSVMAPGIRMISSVPYNHYGNWAGTSMAAPLVAGEVALIRSVYPSVDPKDIVLHVKAQAIPVAGQPRRIDVMRAVTTVPDDRTFLEK